MSHHTTHDHIVCMNIHVCNGFCFCRNISQEFISSNIYKGLLRAQATWAPSLSVRGPLRLQWISRALPPPSIWHNQTSFPHKPSSLMKKHRFTLSLYTVFRNFDNVKIWCTFLLLLELSLYELHRSPQEAITDDTEIAVSPRSLHSELMCPICLDMLKSTYTTKECLHRFCQDCIITALRSG